MWRSLHLASSALALSACHGAHAARPEPAATCSCAVSPDDDERPGCLEPEHAGYRIVRADVVRDATASGARVFDLRSNCGFVWARADGFAMPTVTFDNGADYFCDGLTRTRRGARMGFMNARLEVVVPAIYEFASPFRGGQAIVCNQCQTHALGEHTTIACTKCGIVDTQGRLLSALELASDEAWKRLPEGSDEECGPPP